MQNTKEEHWKAMYIFVGYMKGNQIDELVINKQSESRNMSYCDYSYGDCKYTRERAIGEVHPIGGDIKILEISTEEYFDAIFNQSRVYHAIGRS